MVKTKEQATKEAEELQVEVERLKAELDAYKRKEELWLRRWQQIAFHVRQKGIQMASVDRAAPKDAEFPPNTEASKILKMFDKEIPPSGRI